MIDSKLVYKAQAFMSWQRWLVALSRQTATALIVVSVLIASRATAAPIVFSDVPLVTQNATTSNVLLFLDSSESMRNLVDPFYVDGPKYDVCDGSLARADGKPFTVIEPPVDQQAARQNEIFAHSDSLGNAYFTIDGQNYQWGNANSTDTPALNDAIYPRACFSTAAPTGEDFILSIPGFGDAWSNQVRIKESSNIGNFGRYLNYYFAEEDNNGDLVSAALWLDESNNPLSYKPGIARRVDITKSATSQVIPTLNNINVAFARFIATPSNANDPNRNDSVKTNTGLFVQTKMGTLDSTLSGAQHLQDVLAAVDNMPTDSRTPLGEAFGDIGRYFTEGYNGNLTLRPGTADESIHPAGDVFPYVPRYADPSIAPTSADPIITDSCQRNFVIAMTDGETNEVGAISDLLFDPPYDSDGVPNVLDSSNLQNPIVHRRVLDDAVLAINDIDLRPGPGPEFATTKNNVISFFVAGFGGTSSSNTELSNAVANGVAGTDYPANLIEADDEAELIDAFSQLFDATQSGVFSQTSVAVNAGAIDVGSSLFQASYQNEGVLWSGALEARLFLTSPVDGEIVADTPLWNAGEKLNNRVLDSSRGPDSRVIFTKGVNGDGVAFTQSSLTGGLLSTEMVDDINGAVDDPQLAIDVLEFLRGDESIAGFRTRIPPNQPAGTTPYSVLGDIVNSSPIEVGARGLNYPNTAPFPSALGETYSEFLANHSNRPSVIYVGANDGMVHAFSGDVSVDENGASTGSGGEELFAYIPSMLADGSSDTEGLFYLTDATYGHAFYADGPLLATDVYSESTANGSPSWRTILVGGLRAGGKGLFALDITDPTTFTEANSEDMLLWEFTGEADATGSDDMGHIFGVPQVAMMNDGNFAVIVGNGYNSTSGEAGLFVIPVGAGVDGSWELSGTEEYQFISTGPAIPGDPNGLSTPALVDIDGDLVVDYAYAGDLKGNMWAFDLTDTNGNWGSANDLANTGPLFTGTVTDTGGNSVPQAITSAPLVVRNAEVTTLSTNQPNLMVLFGTGKFIELADYNTSEQQSFYAIWDDGGRNKTRADLSPRTLTAPVGGIREVATGNAVDWTTESGWSIDYSVPRERSLFSPSLLFNTIFFTTTIPSNSPCATDGGGFLNSIGLDGLAVTTPLFDADGDGDIDDDDIGAISQSAGGNGNGNNNGNPNDSAFIRGNGSSNCRSGFTEFYEILTDSFGNDLSRLICLDEGFDSGRGAWQELFGE